MENKVWSNFSYNNNDGTVLKFRIQDAPKDRMDEVRDIFIEYFIKDESMHKLAGIPYSEDALIESAASLTYMLQNLHVSVCFLENGTNADGEIVGVSAMKLVRSTDEDKLGKLEPKSKEFKILLQMVRGLYSLYDVMKSYNVEAKYDGRGIIVHPHYRGFGIGKAFVQTRRMICKEHSIPVTCAWMTSVGTQIAAERDGWETVYEVTIEELEQQFGVTRTDGITSSFKFMVGKSL